MVVGVDFYENYSKSHNESTQARCMLSDFVSTGAYISNFNPQGKADFWFIMKMR